MKIEDTNWKEAYERLMRHYEVKEVAKVSRAFLPRYLYKYYPLSEDYWRANVLNANVVFNFPSIFNDWYDGRWFIDYKMLLGDSKEQFYNILQKNMQPVYDSAKRQGYEVWNYS